MSGPEASKTTTYEDPIGQSHGLTPEPLPSKHSLGDSALAYARRGWPVFPVHGIVGGRCSCRRECSSLGKHPLLRRGLREATTDQRVIKEWWAHWPFANIAVATGDVVVIDIDLPRGLTSLSLTPDLPRTLTSLTGGGGVHLFYSANRELRNHASRLPGLHHDLPGIDLRATGGYVVVPPSNHISGARYEWLDERTPIAPAPDWLREPLRAEPCLAAPATRATESTPYGLAALRSEIDILLRTPVGRRNDQLNRSAFALGQLVAGGELAETPTRMALGAAAQRIGLEAREIHTTTNSGFDSGRHEPRRGAISHT